MGDSAFEGLVGKINPLLRVSEKSNCSSLFALIPTQGTGDAGTGEGGGGGTPGHDEEEAVADVEEVSRHLRHTGVRSRAYALLRARKQVFLAHFLPFLLIGSAAPWHMSQHVASTRRGPVQLAAAA